MNDSPVNQAMDIRQMTEELLELVKNQADDITQKQARALMHLIMETIGYLQGIRQQITVQ